MMALNRSVPVSGTDPNNIRTPGHAIERLAQIERDVKAMHEEVCRIRQLIQAPVQQCLMDEKGMTHGQACERSSLIDDQLSAVLTALEGVHDASRTAVGAIEMSGVRLNYRYEWRPVPTSWEPNLGKRRR